MPIRRTEKGHPIDDAWIAICMTQDSILKCQEITFVKVGIPYQQYQVLRAIKYIPDTVTATVIANWLDKNHNSISMIIDRMQKNGLVKRIKDLPDRRAARIVITPKGEAIYRKAMRPARELPYSLMSTLSRQELLKLTALLYKVREQSFSIRGIQDKVINLGFNPDQDLSR